MTTFTAASVRLLLVMGPLLGACGGRTPLLTDGLQIFTSDGKRGFVAQARVDGFSQPDAYAAVAGDLNGDGRIDAIVSGYGGVRVLMNTCR